MLSRLSKLCAVLVLGVSFSYGATTAEVQAFVEEGVKLCKEKGNEACLKEFNNKDGAFIKGELYMFAYDFDGVNQALGSNPKLVGKNLYKLKDASGLMLIQELIKIAKTDGEGWLDYKWSHPIKKKIADKRSYIKRIDGDMFIGTGFYK